MVYNQTLIHCNDIYETLDEQIYHVTMYRVTGAVFICSRPELDNLSCPGDVIKPVDAPHVINYAKSAECPTAMLTLQQDRVDVHPAPTVASYSNRGSSHSYPYHLEARLDCAWLRSCGSLCSNYVCCENRLQLGTFKWLHCYDRYFHDLSSCIWSCCTSKGFAPWLESRCNLLCNDDYLSATVPFSMFYGLLREHDEQGAAKLRHV